MHQYNPILCLEGIPCFTLGLQNGFADRLFHISVGEYYSRYHIVEISMHICSKAKIPPHVVSVDEYV